MYECQHEITVVEKKMAERLNMNPLEVHLIMDLFEDIFVEEWDASTHES